MNPLAQELNAILDGTAASDLLSDFGKRFYFPKGIVAQSAEAKKQAKRFNATIGMAYHNNEPIELPAIKQDIPDLAPGEAVAYAPTGGDAELCNIWKELIVEKNPTIESKQISTPVVVPGLTNGIMQIADLFIDEGDNIVIPDMFWGNYRLIFESRKQAHIKSFPFFTDSGSLNLAGFESTLRENVKNGKIAVLFNFPNNPTGYSPTTEEADKLTEMVRRCGEDGIKVLAITDDAYFGLFYDEATRKHSLFSELYTIHEHVLAVKIDGATKEDFVWGFRVGFVTFGAKGMSEEQYNALNKKLTGAIRSSVSNSSRPAQSLLKRAIKNDTYRKEKNSYFGLLRARYQKVREILDQRTTGEALTPLPFNSGYFMSFRCDGISAEELRKKLLEEEEIGTISIQDTYLRVAYASIDLENLEDLYSAIFAVADRLKG